MQEHKWTDVRVHNVALARHDDNVPFYYDPSRAGCLGLSRTSTTEKNLASASVGEVLARRLTTFIEGPIDPLKLDIEGAENDVSRNSPLPASYLSFGR